VLSAKYSTLLNYISYFEDKKIKHYYWEESKQDEKGIITLGYPSYDEAFHKFIHSIYDSSIMKQGYMVSEVEDGIGYIKKTAHGDIVIQTEEKVLPVSLDEAVVVRYGSTGLGMEKAENAIAGLYTAYEVADPIQPKQFDVEVGKVLLENGWNKNSIKGFVMEHSANVPSLSDKARDYLNKVVNHAEKERKQEIGQSKGQAR
jgi:hypothetical protein